jgi:hypothetical protein
LYFYIDAIVTIPNKMQLFKNNVFVPSKFTSINVFTAMKVGEKSIYIPVDNDWCGYEPFPCTPYQNPLLELRGIEIKDGFMIKSKL